MPTLMTDPRSGGVKKSSGVNVLPIVAETWSQVRDERNKEVDWLIAGYDQNSKTNVTVLKKGNGGLNTCCLELPERKAVFGGVRLDNGRFVTFFHAAVGTPIMEKGRASMYKNGVLNVLEGSDREIELGEVLKDTPDSPPASASTPLSEPEPEPESEQQLQPQLQMDPESRGTNRIPMEPPTIQRRTKLRGSFERASYEKSSVSSSRLGDTIKDPVPSSRQGNSLKDSIPSSRLGNAIKDPVPSSRQGNSLKESIPSSRLGNASKDSIPSSRQGNSFKDSIPSSRLGNAIKDPVLSSRQGNSFKDSIPSSRLGNASKDSIPSSRPAFAKSVEEPVPREDSVPEVSEPMAELSMASHSDSGFVSYMELKGIQDPSMLPDSVDPLNREQSLSDAEFVEVFGMDKVTFMAQPAWKRTRQKKDKLLF